MKNLFWFALLGLFLFTPLAFSADEETSSFPPEEAFEETEEETEETASTRSLTGMVQGVNRGTEKLLDHAIKGAYRLATLGQSELQSYEIEEPEKGSGEPTKFKISLPGT